MLSSLASVCAAAALSFAPSADRAAKPDMQPPTPQLHPVESKIIERTNAERTRHGLRPLAVDQTLIKSARRHAAWMTNQGVLQHTSLPVAENIAMGQRSSLEAVHDWMNSPGHRANILNPSHAKIGVAAYTAANGTVFWCQQFTH